MNLTRVFGAFIVSFCVLSIIAFVLIITDKPAEAPASQLSNQFESQSVNEPESQSESKSENQPEDQSENQSASLISSKREIEIVPVTMLLSAKAGPEIACWGDSLTKGMGASEAVIVREDGTVFDASYLSYPAILAQLTGLRTFNYGVSGATSEEIAIMQGAWELDEDLLPESQNDESEDESDESDEPDESDESSDSATRYRFINKEVMRVGREHPGDILVIEMGNNGGWNGNYNTLIEQYYDIIEHSGCDDFIIVGDTDDPGTSKADTRQWEFSRGEDTSETQWEKALSREFGDHFLNMRAYLVDYGLETAGLEATDEDDYAASRGCVSEQLRADETHLNSYGYYVQAVAVYEKGQELGYW